ncbi:MAG: ABC transporter permease [Bacteroidetes bacterium]|nr:MAG: ABC transporter permease [Bacteroidota bacterium]
MIHLITRISVIGISVTTAALIILLAAFNGIETMVERLYSDFDAPITIRPAKGKTFQMDEKHLKELRAVEGVRSLNQGVEEIVIVKHEQKWANATLYGVEESFLEMVGVDHHLVDGVPELKVDGEQTVGLIGASLLDKLQGYIPRNGVREQVLLYLPKRDARLSLSKSPFRSGVLQLSARINYNKEVNEQSILVPLGTAREWLGYDQDISVLYVDVKDRKSLEPVQERLSKKLGKSYLVRTQYEKNALIFQTSKTEKMIVVFILVFIFILAIFNLVASLTMLFIEKKDNLMTMRSIGADRKFIFRIFFYEGMLISGRGILFGLLTGALVVAIQYYFELLQLPNSGGQAFPMSLDVWQVGMILGIVLLISFIASYLTVFFLIKNNKQHT